MECELKARTNTQSCLGGRSSARADGATAATWGSGPTLPSTYNTKVDLCQKYLESRSKADYSLRVHGGSLSSSLH